MIKKALAQLLFQGFFIQRWNDRIRPIEFTEIDKHAHKMIIAYCIGKYEEKQGFDIRSWIDLIKCGIFEAIRRFIISDIKSPVFHKIIESHPDVMSQLNAWVLKEITPKLDTLPSEIKDEFSCYLNKPNSFDSKAVKVLEAAHKYASWWEFQAIKNLDPFGYDIGNIETRLSNSFENSLDLEGMRKLLTKHGIAQFVDICGRMRYQCRWSQTPKIPRTSVLGHMFFVASILFFLSLEARLCNKRIYNNFFSGLFHDLPEAVTRDIISPVKYASDALKDALSKLEQQLMEEQIYPYISEGWRTEFNYFIDENFNNRYMRQSKLVRVGTDEIDDRYNHDEFSPLDGQLVKRADSMAAFVEASTSIQLGVKSDELETGKRRIMNGEANKTFAHLNFDAFYADY